MSVEMYKVSVQPSDRIVIIDGTDLKFKIFTRFSGGPEASVTVKLCSTIFGKEVPLDLEGFNQLPVQLERIVKIVEEKQRGFLGWEGTGSCLILSRYVISLPLIQYFLSQSNISPFS